MLKMTGEIPVTNESSTTLRLTIDGMTCSACERHVREALESVRGVLRATVSVSEAVATVEYDADAAVPAELIMAVEDAGYTARAAEDAAATPKPPSACGCCSPRPSSTADEAV